eukprot:6189177-Pleurochrysis_carterae.AAC.2
MLTVCFSVVTWRAWHTVSAVAVYARSCADVNALAPKVSPTRRRRLRRRGPVDLAPGEACVRKRVWVRGCYRAGWCECGARLTWAAVCGALLREVGWVGSVHI